MSVRKMPLGSRPKGTPSRKPSKPKPKPAPPPPPPKKPAHRPPYEPTDQDRTTVKVMTAGGMDQEAIASVIGLTRKTLRKHFRRELNSAAPEANALVVASLHHMATKGRNVAAAIWWTKTRMRWSEKITVEGEGDFGFGKMLEILEQRRQKPAGTDDA